MKCEKQTELVKRAKKFHELWEKGYSVADAAEKMGISKSTIYDQLDKYAEINGVESRSSYISEYSARAGTEHSVTYSEESSIPILQEEFDDRSHKLEYEEILTECDKWMSLALDLIGSLDSIIRVYLRAQSNNVKEEKV